MRATNMGIEIDGVEQFIWAKANTRTYLALNSDNLQAVTEEHTEPADDGSPEWRKIPAADFERARDTLGAFVCRYEALLDSGILQPDHSLLVAEIETSINIATELEDAICDNIMAR